MRHDHIVDTNGNAGTRRVTETGVHQLVGKDHGLLQPHLPVAGIDAPRDGLLGHRLVDQVEAEAVGQDVP